MAAEQGRGALPEQAAVPLAHGRAERGAAESAPGGGGVKPAVKAGKRPELLDFSAFSWYNFNMEKAKKQAVKTGETVTISREEYEAFQVQARRISELEKQVDRLMEAIRLSQSKRFGPSSEKRQLNEEELCEQLGFVFNEAEAYQPKEAKKQETRVAGYTRTRRGGSVEEILPENVPVDVVEHHIPEEERSCPDCGSRMEEIGKEARRRLVIIPAQVRRRTGWIHTGIWCMC